MKVEVLHDDQDARIEINPAQRLFRFIWKRPVMGKDYRTILMLAVKLMKERQVLLWLNDGRNAGPILYDDQVWTMKEVIPLVLKAGLLRIALVNSHDGLNLLAVDRLVNATPPDAPYSIGFFEDPAIAQLWLMDPSKAKESQEVPPPKGSSEP